MAVATAPERERGAIDAKYTWNLDDVYPDEAAWRAEKLRIAAAVPGVRRFAGRLGESPATLAEAMDTIARLDKDITRLYTYASMLADQDTRLSGPQGMQQEMQQLHAEFSAQASYLQPEVLRLGAAAVEGFLAAEPRLATYAFLLRDIIRRAAHTLSDAEERLLADVQPLAGSASNIYGILANADFPYPTLRLDDGREVRLDQAGYAELRTSPHRVEREAAMSGFFTALSGFSRTYGTTMNSSVQKAAFYARARRYGSALEASLDRPNIPVSVYTRLIEGVNRNLPTFHRYLRLRRRMLGVEALHYYDLYAPLVASVDVRYTPEEAQQLVEAASVSLGGEYVATLQHAFSHRWLDWYPGTGKRSGAYSNGSAYDVHPYILLNYLGQYNDVSTLAHELGHTMHSFYSNRAQPYHLADYPTFLAEVASTFNEALLIDYMLRTTTDAPMRLSLLGSYLENIKATVFRQTQFAEFELLMHDMGWRGEPITGEALARLYQDVTRRYYGHDEGVTVVDDYVAHEWSYIPHFYSEFYVFQYATSFTAAETLAARVLAGDRDTRDRYLALLSAGGSKYPIDALGDAGVDMTSDEPLNVTVQTMNRIMDEIEGILG